MLRPAPTRPRREPTACARLREYRDVLHSPRNAAPGSRCFVRARSSHGRAHAEREAGLGSLLWRGDDPRGNRQLSRSALGDSEDVDQKGHSVDAGTHATAERVAAWFLGGRPAPCGRGSTTSRMPHAGALSYPPAGGSGRFLSKLSPAARDVPWQSPGCSSYSAEVPAGEWADPRGSPVSSPYGLNGRR